MTDLVNHPPHYTAHPSGVECITITEHMGFNVGNAVKYLWRADEKGNALEDLRKAAWYVQREIAKREVADRPWVEPDDQPRCECGHTTAEHNPTLSDGVVVELCVLCRCGGWSPR